MQKTIFVVDDSLSNLSLAEEALENHYRVITLSSADKMYKTLEKLVPDLILLDIAMPDESGFDAMKKLKSIKAYSDIPVIFLTALTDTFNEALGIELGAIDFITKPFSEAVLLNRVRNHIQIDELVHKRTEQLNSMKDSIVLTMSSLVESRDVFTGGHIERTTKFLKILLGAMIDHGVYIDEIDEWDVDSFVSSARLHDVGKIYVADAILNKPKSLSQAEFESIKTHSSEGEKIIDQMIKQTGDMEFLHSAKLVAAYHHERWDGSGYPYGLSGEEIPLPGRLMAIIDVYDALVSERPYKKPVAHEDAVKTIISESGTHFDPKIIEVFRDVNDRFAL